jgi:hypothetical protein
LRVAGGYEGSSLVQKGWGAQRTIARQSTHVADHGKCRSAITENVGAA